MLPFKQAIRLPFHLSNKIRFIKLSGKVNIECSNIHFCMVRIGGQGADMFSGQITTIDIAGQLIIKGDRIRIGYGTLLRIEKSGCIELEENSRIGAKNLIFGSNYIKLCSNSGLSWECQVMDSDTHCIQNIETGEIYPSSKPVIIEKNCWIGNHVIINKGTIIPPNTIVSSNSLCNKNYTSTIKEYSVIGGVPAKLLSNNKKRIN